MKDKENMNPNTRMRTRQRKQEYIDLLDRLDEIKEIEVYSDETIIEVGEIMQKCSDLAREGNSENGMNDLKDCLLDSKVLLEASTALVRSMQVLEIKKAKFDWSDFAKRLLERFGNGEEPELDLCTLVPELNNHYALETPSLTSLYNEIDIINEEPDVQPKLRVRPEKQRLGQIKRPDKVNSVIKDESNLDETIKFIRKVLKQEYQNNNCVPLDYHQFVIDKHNFEETIENMFHCNFLINDGFAKVTRENENSFTIKPTNKEIVDQSISEKKDRLQMIVPINYNSWMLRRESMDEGLISKHRRLEKGNCSKV